MSGNFSDGARWYMSLESEWSYMIAVHESIHDDIAKETPFGQIISLMSLLQEVDVLDFKDKAWIRDLYYDCFEISRRVSEVSATYLGWLSVVGYGHLEVLQDISENEEYKAYFDEAQKFASRFAKSRFIQYTVVQAATYLAFHHSSLLKLTEANDVEGFVLPVESSPDKLWDNIKNILSEKDVNFIKNLIRPSCNKFGIDFDKVNVDFETIGPDQELWINANDELVKYLRIALAEHLELNVIIDTDEREKFHIDLCKQVERFFGVVVDRVYSRESIYHILFPDKISTGGSKINTVVNLDFGNFTETIKEIKKNNKVFSTAIISDKFTVVVSDENNNADLFQWDDTVVDPSVQEGFIENVLKNQDLDFKIIIVSAMLDENEVSYWLDNDSRHKKFTHVKNLYFYPRGSFEHWVNIILKEDTVAQFLRVHVRRGDSEKGEFVLGEFSVGLEQGTDRKIVLWKVLTLPSAEFIRKELSDKGGFASYVDDEVLNIHIVRHILWGISDL